MKLERVIPTAAVGVMLLGCPGDETPTNPFDTAPATDTTLPGTSSGTTVAVDGTASDGPMATETAGASGESTAEDGGIKLDVGSPDLPGTMSDGCTFIDVLFVVDISASMLQEKANLAANFPSFVQVLEDYIADPTSNATAYRLGVTNSSIVDNGTDQSTMGLDGELFDGSAMNDCGTGATPWLDGPDPDIVTNFNCLAPNPRSDCMSCTDFGHERPLDAIEYFVDESAVGGVNEGFYRGDDALLVIVLLTDEDDDAAYTTTVPASTKAALDGFVGGEERYVVVTIAGPQNMGCNSAFGSASPAPLLHEFTGLVANGLMGDICQGDLAQPLADALALIQTSCDSLPPPAG
ncbi:hypothetical protein [Paraliomyxa miuraensis]|uniref:hypothetical protein n=1 Tax=Paraliomyxa miuraensis TaxID=376150 RepID=UPI00225ABBCB|nr:hypothetical protein [Paraliomyxa miuraensis]MCX4245953.1 hypothetical protein [Paraliomyxa miuraensis]